MRYNDGMTIALRRLCVALRRLRVLLLLLSLSLPLHAAPLVLRVGGAGAFKLPDKNATDPQSRGNRAIVDAFERLHPDIELQNAQGLQIGGPQAEASMMLAFAGGTAPDVVYVNFRTSAQYIQQGFIIPLDAYVQREPDTVARLNPVVRKVLHDVGHGHIYSLPWAQYVLALYYRKDLFQAAGLDPDKPPQDWDEFYTDAQRMTDQPKGIWGFEFKTGPEASAVWWVDFLWQAGGEVIQRNPQGRWEAAFNSPAGVTALNFYKKLKTAPWKGRDGKTYVGVATNSPTADQDRVQGKCGMWFQYQSNIIANQADVSSVNPSLIGIAPLPKGPTGIQADELNAAMWGISSQIKDPRVREAAWQFVKFMGSDDADRIRTQAYVEAGLGNTVNPESLQKYGYGDYTTRASCAWLAANHTLFQHGHPEPYAENMSQIYTLLANPLSNIETNPQADPRQLLDQSAREINTKLTGYVSPRIMAARRRTAWAIFAALMLLLVGVLGFAANRARLALAAYRAQGSSGPRAAGMTTRAHVLAWLFMLPAVGSVVVWAYYPLARGLVMAFQNYHILGPAQWVGLDNFIDCFHQPSFWFGVRNSCLYTLYSLFLGFFLPVFLALALSEIPRGRVLFRTFYYLPAVTASLAITFMWKIFETSTPDGLLNRILALATRGHAGPIHWLDDPHWALVAVLLPVIWAAAGPGSIIYLAALKSVPDEMYEAADLDGAGIWTKIWRITLPTLAPLLIINLLGATIGAFQASQNIIVQTGGGPQYATHTLGLEVFYNAFLFLKFGYATAVAWIMGAMLVGFTLYQLRITKKLKFSQGKA